MAAKGAGSVGIRRCAVVLSAVLGGSTAYAQTAPGPAPANAATPAPASAPAPASVPPSHETVEQVPEDQVVSLLGLATRGSDGKEIGRIVDVLIDGRGQPRAVVIDAGGFLGMGNRKVAVEWVALHFTFGKTPVATLGLPSERIKSAPAYDPAKPVEAVGIEPGAAAPATPPVSALAPTAPAPPPSAPAAPAAPAPAAPAPAAPTPAAPAPVQAAQPPPPPAPAGETK